MRFALSAIADYAHQSLRFDLVAGFTVGMIAVPQANVVRRVGRTG